MVEESSGATFGKERSNRLQGEAGGESEKKK